MNWYIALTQPVRERIAALFLIKDGRKVFLPECEEEVVSERFGTKYVRRALLFPRYIFLNIAEGECGPVCRTPGITNILSMDGLPKAIDPEIVDELLGRAKAGGGVVKLDTPFSFSEPLTLLSGPFEGRKGNYLWKSGNRVAMLMAIFGGSRVIHAELAQVSRAI